MTSLEILSRAKAGQSGNRKTKNKKNTGNKANQKEDEAWKKVPSKSRDKKSKEVGKYTYH